MAAAARWCDELLPRVATPQWVVTLPWERRWLLDRRPELNQGVVKRALAEIFGWNNRQAGLRGIAEAKCGAVAAQQRIGTAPNLNIHFHVLVPEGVFAPDDRAGVDRIRFYRAAAPTTEVVGRIVEGIADRVEARLAVYVFESTGLALPAEDTGDETVADIDSQMADGADDGEVDGDAKGSNSAAGRASLPWALLALCIVRSGCRGL